MDSINTNPHFIIQRGIHTKTFHQLFTPIHTHVVMLEWSVNEPYHSRHVECNDKTIIEQ